MKSIRKSNYSKKLWFGIAIGFIALGGILNTIEIKAEELGDKVISTLNENSQVSKDISKTKIEENVIIGDFICDLYSDNTVSINGYIGSGFLGNTELDKLNYNSQEYIITSIGKKAFAELTDITSIKMPNVETIEDEAFYKCEELQMVNMPNVKTIGNEVFLGCLHLKTVNIPNVKTIGDAVFVGCYNLENIEMESVENIGRSAFVDNVSLKNISVPNLKTIGYCSFADCEKLESVMLPVAKTLDNGAFSGCTNLKTITMQSVESIGKSAFSNCTNLTTVTISSLNFNISESADDEYSVAVFSETPLATENSNAKLYVRTSDIKNQIIKDFDLWGVNENNIEVIDSTGNYHVENNNLILENKDAKLITNDNSNPNDYSYEYGAFTKTSDSKFGLFEALTMTVSGIVFAFSRKIRKYKD